MNGELYNFNSLYPAPESLSDFYLTAYLDSLKEQGYTIFVVRGDLPAAMMSNPNSGGGAAEGGGGGGEGGEGGEGAAAAGSGAQQENVDGPGKWWTPEEVRGCVGV